VRRVADEFKAGVRYFDLHIGGSSSVVSGMLDEGLWICDWDKRPGVSAAKDRMSVKVFLQVENQSEERPEKIREPAQKFAPALLKSV
jgi:hypothetical protein